MRVFVSYAREDRKHAADIVMALRGRGHEVFFDADPQSLPPGAPFDHRIQAAIEGAHRFIFLISPDSVVPGGCALTELAIAERAFKHPADRVLPVLLRPTPIESIPPFLRAVTFLQPRGNPAAEIGLALGNATTRRTRLVVASIAAGVAVTGAIAIVNPFAPRPEIAVDARPVGLWEHGLFGRPDSFLLLHENKNVGSREQQIVDATARVEPQGSVKISEAGDVSDATPLRLAPGQLETNQFIVTTMVSGPKPRSWTACINVRNGGEICSAPRPWEPVATPRPRPAFSLPAELAANLVAVTAGADRFYLLARRPNRIVVVSVDGSERGHRVLDGEPTAMIQADGDLFVSTRGPNEIARYAAATLEPVARRVVAFPPEINGAFGDPVSSTPVILAADRANLYVLTRGGASATGLIVFARDLAATGAVPPYFDDVSSSLRDMHLVSSQDGAWGAQTGTTSASLHRFEPKRFAEFKGHDFDVASCATDVLPDGQALILPECDGRIVKASVADGMLNVDHTIQEESGMTSGPGLWTTQLIRRSTNVIAVATNLARPGGKMVPINTSIWITRDSGRAYRLLKFPDAQIVDFALLSDRLLVIFEDPDGRRDARALLVD